MRGGWSRLNVLAAVLLAGMLGASVATPGAAAGTRTGGGTGSHYNVGAAHSPQLLRQLAGPSGHGGRASRVPSRPRGAVQGVDVAAFQHPGGRRIQWSKVAKAGIRFAAIKATEGNYYANPYYASDRARASAAGLTVVAYGFANPRPHVGNGTAADQARYLVRHAGKLNGRTPPLMLDIEYNPYYGGECYTLSKAAMVGWLKGYDGEIRKLTGHLPIIYTTAGWWNKCTGRSRAFRTSLMWPAAWTTASGPPMPVGWRNWALWQYTSTATVPGIGGARSTDLDALNLIAPSRRRNAAIGRRVSVPVSHVVSRAVTGLKYASSKLPAGLTVHATGVISGTPTVAGTPRSSTVTAAAEGKKLGSIKVNWNVVGSSGKPDPALP